MMNDVTINHPLADRINYVTDEKYIISSVIREYDISKANINILRSFGKLTEYEYIALYSSDKLSREKYIGLKMRNELNSQQNVPGAISDTALTIKTGISMAKDMFLTANNIPSTNIIRIANDAVYVNSTLPPKYTSFDINQNGHLVKFNCKNTFTSFINIGGLLIFFNILPDDNFNIDVIGISNDLLQLHQCLLGFIGQMMLYMERTDKETAIRSYVDFYEKYVNLSLPIEYYREFSSDSCYRLKRSDRISNICPRYVDEKYKNQIDISYNIYILRELYNILLNY